MAKVVYQKHHLSYTKPEIIVKVRKGVHQICTLIMRYKYITPIEKRAIRHALECKPEE